MTEQPELPPVDELVLIELINQVGDDDGTFRDELIGSYLAEATDQVARLLTAARTDDAETVRSVAHSLRSASALLGAEPFARLLAKAEQVAVTTPADVAALDRPVELEFARVAEAFALLRSTHSVG